jgi:hypothetical protein
MLPENSLHNYAVRSQHQVSHIPLISIEMILKENGFKTLDRLPMSVVIDTNSRILPSFWKLIRTTVRREANLPQRSQPVCFIL